MEFAASHTFSGLLEHMASTHPDRPTISSPGGQKLTVAQLNQLAVAAASRILSSGVLPRHHVALVFGNTTAEEEFEIFLTEYEIKLLLTGPPSTDEETRAQAAAARLQIPHAIASVDFHSGHVDISSFLLPSAPSAGAGSRSLAEVVNKPGHVALLLHGARPTAWSPACGDILLTQEELASGVMGQDDVLNLLSELNSCLPDVKLVENPAAWVASRPSNGARVPVRNPTTIGRLVTGGGEVPHGLFAATGESPEVVAGIDRAEEDYSTLKDILIFYAAILLTVTLVGQIIMTEGGRFQKLFKMANLFSFFFVVTTLRYPGFGCHRGEGAVGTFHSVCC